MMAPVAALIKKSRESFKALKDKVAKKDDVATTL
jgi:hypothetical protein